MALIKVIRAFLCGSVGYRSIVFTARDTGSISGPDTSHAKGRGKKKKEKERERDTLKNEVPRVPIMAQWVKNPALCLQGFGFHPWPCSMG